MSKKMMRALCATLLIGGMIMAGTVQAAALKERRTAVITPSAGVDATSSPLEVAAGRASSMSNIIGDAGMLRKRPGWREVARCGVGTVHGMWSMGDGTMAVHAGVGLYIVTEESGEYASREVAGITLPDCRMVGVYARGRLWLYGGGAAVTVRAVVTDGEVAYVAENVAQAAYVPVTTIGIGAMGHGSEAGERLEAVNMMTQRRVNRLIGEEQEGGDRTVTYKLDGKPDLTKDFIVRVTTVNSETYEETVTELKKAIVQGKGYLLGIVVNGTLLYDHEYGKITQDGLLTINYSYADGEGVLVQHGIDMTPFIAGRDNIEVEFTAVAPEGTFGAELLASATVGTVFSTDNMEDRLFLGGFADAPERVYYSAEGDFSYFPDTGYITCGTSVSGVNGFSRLSDGVLAVHKAAGGQEAGIYFVSGQEVDRFDEDGIIASHELRLYVKPGSASESIVTAGASADLYGDPLVLTRTGVFAVEQTVNISTAERKLTERSRNIRSLIRREKAGHLAEAVGTVFDGRYWLAVPASERVYIADAGQVFADEAGRRSYEWYIYDNVPAVCWGQLRGCLLFGTERGRIMRMGSLWDEKAVYYDEYTDVITAGTVTTVMSGDEPEGITPENGYVTVPEDFDAEAIEFNEPTVGGKVSGLCAKLFEAEAYTDGGMTVFRADDPDDVGAVAEGMTVTADVMGTSLPVGTVYEVTDVDRASGTFRMMIMPMRLYVQYGTGTRLRILRPLGGCRMLCTKEDGVSGVVRLSFDDGSGVPCLTFPGGVAGTLTGRYIIRRPVVAEWVSPVTDLGTNMAEKTVLDLTVSTEPVENGQVLVGYETRTDAAMYGSTGIGGLDLGGMAFTDFTLSGFASSYTKRLWVRHVNFIALRYRSELPLPCCVHDLTIRYKIGRINRGGA